VSQQINLYYEESRKAGGDLSALSMLQGAGVIALAVCAFYVYTFYQVDLLQQQIDESGKNLAVQQERLNGLTAQRAGLTIEQEIKKAEAEVIAQREIINALKSGAIGNTRGYSDYMQAFAKQALGGLWLTGFSIAGDAAQMKISGATLNPELVPAYILRLNHEKIMRGKTFASLQMQLPKAEEGKPETTQYLEFVLQSVGANEADKK
jgi:hypothetical protein